MTDLSLKFAENGLPNEVIKLPLPLNIKDIQQLLVFPEKYQNKIISIERIVTKDNFRSKNDEYLIMDSQESIKFLAKKELFNNDGLINWPPVVNVRITGEIQIKEAEILFFGKKIEILK